MTEHSIRQLIYKPVSELKPDPRNPRKHSREQIAAIARSIEAFGFNAPILVDRHKRVLVGHGRLEAAKSIGIVEVPIVCLEDLSDEQARAYMIADNQLTERSCWDDRLLAVHLQELSDMALEFDIEATGFELPEIDLRIQSLETAPENDPDDTFEVASGPAVSRAGDLWLLGNHRLFCGNALDRQSFDVLMEGSVAAAVFTDPPYNVKIDGHVSGLGRVRHREFAMASGEMSEAEFASFLTNALKLSRQSTLPGAVIYVCMDFRHMGEILSASRANSMELLNLCVWVKTNGGMGSFYRSGHELVFVFCNGGAPHRNNIQLGRFGRNRTNVWNYAGANIRPPKGAENLLSLHPTVKPVMLVADAIRDSTVRGDIVLDPFAGSGTLFLAAERVQRRGYGMEIDPDYVDTAILRWQRKTGKEARHRCGATFNEVKCERSIDQ